MVVWLIPERNAGERHCYGAICQRASWYGWAIHGPLDRPAVSRSGPPHHRDRKGSTGRLPSLAGPCTVHRQVSTSDGLVAHHRRYLDPTGRGCDLTSHDESSLLRIGVPPTVDMETGQPHLDPVSEERNHPTNHTWPHLSTRLTPHLSGPDTHRPWATRSEPGPVRWIFPRRSPTPSGRFRVRGDAFPTVVHPPVARPPASRGPPGRVRAFRSVASRA